MTVPKWGDTAAIAAVRESRRPDWVKVTAKSIKCPRYADRVSQCPGSVAFSAYDSERERAAWRCTCGLWWQTGKDGAVVG